MHLIHENLARAHIDARYGSVEDRLWRAEARRIRRERRAQRSGRLRRVRG